MPTLVPSLVGTGNMNAYGFLISFIVWSNLELLSTESLFQNACTLISRYIVADSAEILVLVSSASFDS